MLFHCVFRARRTLGNIRKSQKIQNSSLQWKIEQLKWAGHQSEKNIMYFGGVWVYIRILKFSNFLLIVWVYYSRDYIPIHHCRRDWIEAKMPRINCFPGAVLGKYGDWCYIGETIYFAEPLAFIFCKFLYSSIRHMTLWEFPVFCCCWNVSFFKYRV